MYKFSLNDIIHTPLVILQSVIRFRISDFSRSVLKKIYREFIHFKDFEVTITEVRSSFSTNCIFSISLAFESYTVRVCWARHTHYVRPLQTDL